MSQVITKRSRVSRRAFLKGVTLSGTAIQVGLPPLVTMFNSHRNRYAADAPGKAESRSRAGSSSGSTATASRSATGSRAETGRDFGMTPCLAPLAPFRNDIHVITGFDNSAAGMPGPGNGHHKSMSGADDLHAVYRTRRGRPLDRSGDSVENRRRIALPFVADRCLPGIVRREHSAQHELVWLRSPAASGNAAATGSLTGYSAAGRRLGQSQAEHPGCGTRGCRCIAEGSAERRRSCASTSNCRPSATSSAHHGPAARVPPDRSAGV